MVDRMERDERRRAGCCYLSQRERPHQSARRRRVLEGTPGTPGTLRGDQLPGDQGDENRSDDGKIGNDASREVERVDQESRGDEEYRDEERLPDEFASLLGGLVVRLR